ncbi:MAG: hypothetical protein RMK19_04075 [Bacteroidia bacterium]|nr:hypothetical protein [Bacteroidia bacterium]MDW8015168.1 hypothetical protein [Bacteroidia bacterium]
MRLIGEWDLPGHAGPVYALACDYEQHVLFSAGADGCIAEWRCTTGKQARALARTPNAVYALHWVPALHHLYVGESSGTIYVLDLDSKVLRRSIRAHQSSVFGLASHPTDAEGWSSGRDGQFLYWDIEQSQPFVGIHVTPAGLRSFVLSPTGTDFLCAGRDGWIYEIQRSARQVTRRIQADPSFLMTIQSAPRQGLIATGGKSGLLRIWNKDLILLLERPAHTYALNAIAWHPSEKILATGGRDKLIHLWNPFTGEKLLTLQGHLRSVNALLWISTDTLASAGDDGLIKIWHLEELPDK